MDKDESVIFFSNYVTLLEQYMVSTATLACAQTFNHKVMHRPRQYERALKEIMTARKAAYEANKDALLKAAFEVLDTGKDGKLQEEEVLEALLHGHAKNKQLLNALGFLMTTKEIGDAMEALPEGQE